MTDITLYRIREGQAQELPKQAATVEKSLQTLIEANLEITLHNREDLDKARPLIEQSYGAS